MPPALARYWAERRDGRKLRRSERGAVAVSRAAPSNVSVWARLKRAISPADPISMGLFGAAGYLLPNALTATGLPWAAYTSSQNAAATNPNSIWGKYSTLVNNLYNSGETISGYTGKPNPWVNGGASGWGKILGLGLATDVIYKSSKSGRVSGRALNVEGPLALGLILDPPASGNSPSSGASGDYW
jgi:hypothetical protein